MRSCISTFASVILLLLGTELPAAELDNFTLISEFVTGYETEDQGSMQGQLELMPELEFSLSNDIALVLSARVRLDYEDLLEPDRPQLDTYLSITEPLEIGTAGTAELRDMYLEFRSDNGLSRIGKQQIVWGRMDGIKVLDILNPRIFGNLSSTNLKIPASVCGVLILTIPSVIGEPKLP